MIIGELPAGTWQLRATPDGVICACPEHAPRFITVRGGRMVVEVIDYRNDDWPERMGAALRMMAIGQERR